MEDLGVNLCFLKDYLRNLAVLTRATLDEIDDIIDTACLKSVLLLLVTTVHDGSCQIISCLPFDDEVEHVVSECSALSLFPLLSLLWFRCVRVSGVMDPKHPQEIAERKRLQLDAVRILSESLE